MRQLMGFLTVIGFVAACAWGIVHEYKREEAPPDAVAFSYASTRLASAADRMQQTHDYLGSYVGLDRNLFEGMQIAYATDDGFCLHMAREGGWYHLAGPGGTPARGACSSV